MEMRTRTYIENIMSIAKSLIQKEIDRLKRALTSRKLTMKHWQDDLKSAKEEHKKELSERIEAWQKDTALFDKMIKELEADLKKL